MKVSQLLDAMLEWVKLLSEHGGSPEKQAMGSFVELLRGHETKTVAAFASRLKELSVFARNEQGEGLVRINTLVKQFRGLSRFCNHIKANQAAKDFDIVAAALLHHGTVNVEEFLAVAEIGLVVRSRGTPRGRVAMDPSLISSYVSQFRNVTNETEFERVKEALKKDGAINKDALSQIVNEVSGHVGSFANKNDAYQQLRDAFIEQARFRNKIKQ